MKDKKNKAEVNVLTNKVVNTGIKEEVLNLNGKGCKAIRDTGANENFIDRCGARELNTEISKISKKEISSILNQRVAETDEQITVQA